MHARHPRREEKKQRMQEQRPHHGQRHAHCLAWPRLGLDARFHNVHRSGERRGDCGSEKSCSVEDTMSAGNRRERKMTKCSRTCLQRAAEREVAAGVRPLLLHLAVAGDGTNENEKENESKCKRVRERTQRGCAQQKQRNASRHARHKEHHAERNVAQQRRRSALVQSAHAELRHDGAERRRLAGRGGHLHDDFGAFLERVALCESTSE